MTLLLTLALSAHGWFAGETAGAEPDDVPPARAYAIDKQQLTIIDESTLTALGSLPLPQSRFGFWWNNAAQDRLAMVFGPWGESTLVIFDLEAKKVLKSSGIGKHARTHLVSSDGRVGYVLLWGERKKMRFTPTLLAVETDTGTTLASTTLDTVPTDVFFNANGEGIIVVFGGLNRAKEHKRQNASVQLLDASTLGTKNKYELPGPVTGIYLDDPGRLYFLNPGIDRTSDKKQAPGEVYVVDRQTLELKTTLNLGMAPGPLAWDEERSVYYVLTSPRATKKDTEAQLLLISGERIAKTLTLPEEPLAMQPSLDRQHYYVMYKDRVVRADADLEESDKVLSLEKTPIQLFEHPRNGHFYALHFNSPVVSVANGQTGNVVTKIRTGRTGKKIGKVVAAVAAQVAVTGLAMQGAPAFSVGGNNYYYVPNVTHFGAVYQRTFGTFSEDARYLYVFNASTNDVTVIDTMSQQEVTKVAGGRNEFRTVHEGRYLCTVSPGSVRFFDIEGSFELQAKYDTADADLLAIPGTTKAYLSRGPEKPVGVIDFDELGGITEIQTARGRVFHLIDYN